MTGKDYRKLFRDGMLIKKIIDREVDSLVAVSDEEVLNYYKLNLDMFLQTPEVLQVRAIFMKLDDNILPEEIDSLHNKALKICSEIKNGAIFEKMADSGNKLYIPSIPIYIFKRIPERCAKQQIMMSGQ